MSSGIKIFSLALAFVSTTLFAAIDVRSEYLELRDEIEARVEQVEKALVYVKGRVTSYSGETRLLLQEEYQDIEQMKATLLEKLYYAEGKNAEDWLHVKRKLQIMTNKLEGRVNNVF